MVLTLLLILAVGVNAPDRAMQRLTQLHHAAAVTPADVAEALREGLAGLDQAQTRGDQCLNQYYTGELYRLAAAADPSGDYAEQALKCFRDMRVEYLNLNLSLLGYVGEARLLRQQDKPEEALAVLKPLLNQKNDPRLYQLGQLESMEATLMTDPATAAQQAEAFGDGAEWLLARADARTGRSDEALRLARLDVTVNSAPSFDRLELIAQLGGLTDNEREQWASVLTSLGRLAEALAVLDGREAPAPSSLYAALLAQAGRHEQAAQQWRLVVDADGDPAAIFAMAQELEASSQRDPALTAYWRAVESSASDELRRQALIRWSSLKGTRDSLDGLQAHRDLIGDDPYLCYALAASKFTNGWTEGLSDEMDTVAQKATDDDLRAAARLLQVEADPDPHAAMQNLDRYWNLLETNAGTSQQAYTLRAQLWTQLGMIDSVVKAMLAEPQRYSATALLKAAEALASRYRELPDATQRQSVLRLCDQAIRNGGDAERAAAAELMLRIDAFSDAQRVALTLKGPDAQLLEAQALRGQQNPQDALRVLEGIASSQAAMIRGQCELDLGRNDRAAEEFRAARAEASANSDTWWQATFALCRAQAALGQDKDAAALLRVAGALYPLDDRPQLSQQFQALQSELQP